ncbi:hypothetical protein FNV43_RR12894 [Rhamnella rubrinervis]|uniref:Transcription factor n=1 Tax=Rhamnella rubrinervis TaxID=2594499 RepID=A0A8K0MED7_9ROSA|nr:hypothetical protein FNV43_RR12894 [Rhamnella rubrinervis]
MMNNNVGSSSNEGVAASGSASSRGGGGAESTGGLKKGPWTAAEDSILVEYVKKHGEGNWNAVQKNSGLARCGKSCRLRWANHLRPNLKKGSFTPDEERIIIELHAKLGNKWARMASQLPGRTDNEIKNYWNTRMKRRQRAGLPLYPHEVQQEVASFHLQHQHQQQQQRNPNPSSSSSSSLSSLLSTSLPRKPSYAPPFPLHESLNFSLGANQMQSQHPSVLYSHPPATDVHQFKFFADNNSNNGGFSLPLSLVSPFGSSASSTLFGHSIRSQAIRSSTTTPSPLMQHNSVAGNFGSSNNGFSFSSMVIGPPFQPIPYELPSNQTPQQSTLTPASSNTSTGCEGYMGANSSNANDVYDFGTQELQLGRSSGLLDAVLVESRTKSHKSMAAESLATNKGKEIIEEQGLKKSMETSTAENQTSSSQSSIGMYKPSEDPLMEDMNSMDDDLMSLLNNFPSTMPVPDWYRRSSTVCNGQSSSAGISGGSARVEEVPQNMSPTPAPAPKHDQNLDACYWNNMPSIC